MSKQNVNTLNIDLANMDQEHYTKQTLAYGARLAREAKRLEKELDLDLDPVLLDTELQGWHEGGYDESGNSVIDVFEQVDIEGMAIDDLSGWERHGLYDVEETAGRGARRMVRVDREELANDQGFEYAGDHAVGMGTYTLVPDFEARKAAARKRVEAPAQTVAQMLRDLAKEGVNVTRAQRQRFERKVAKADRTKERLVEWLAADAK